METEGDTYIHSTLEEGYDFCITDKWSKKFHFKIATFPGPSGLVSEAIEVDNSSPYTFSIFSDSEADIEHCELLLKAKIKRGINRRYLEENNRKIEINENMELAGRIEYNDDVSDSNFEKNFVIDGKKITIEKFTEMLDSYEGWNFKFKIFDRFDEVE